MVGCWKSLGSVGLVEFYYLGKYVIDLRPVTE